MNPARQRAILAAQKVRRVDDPKLIEEAMKPTAEHRRAMYAPKPANTAPEHIRGSEWISAWRTVERITYGITAIGGLLFGGLIASESKKSIRQ